MRDNLIAGLILVFVPFSLTSIGGGGAIIAGIQNETVNVHGWLSAADFIHLFAVSRAAPGPGMMLATVIGWKLAGWLGAVTASLALFLPSSLLCYAVFRWSNTHREKRWHRAMREGLAPVGIGLILAGIISLFRVTDGGMLGLLIACLATAILYVFPKFPVLIVLALGGGGAVLASGGWPVTL